MAVVASVKWRKNDAGDYDALLDGEVVGAVWRDGAARWDARYKGLAPLRAHFMDRFSSMRDAQVWVEGEASRVYSSARPHGLPLVEPAAPGPKQPTWVVFEVTSKRLYVLEGDERSTEYNGSPVEEVARDWFHRPRGSHGSLGVSHASRDRHEVAFSEEAIEVTHRVVDRDGLADILDPDRALRGEIET